MMKITVYNRDPQPFEVEESSLDKILVHIFPKDCPLSSLTTSSTENWIPIDRLDSKFFGDISFKDVISQEDIETSKDGFIRVTFQLYKDGDNTFHLKSNDFDSIKFELDKQESSESGQSPACSDDDRPLFEIVSGGLPNLYFTIAETVFGCIHRVKCFLEDVIDVIINEAENNNEAENHYDGIKVKEFLYNYYSVQQRFFDRDKCWKWDRDYKDTDYWEEHKRAKKIREWHNKEQVEFSLLEKYHETFVANVYKEFSTKKEEWEEAAKEFNNKQAEEYKKNNNNNNKKNKKTIPTNAEYQFVYSAEKQHGMKSKIMNAWYLNEGWNIEFSNFCDFVRQNKQAINKMCRKKNKGKDPSDTIIDYCKTIQDYRNRTSHNIKAQAAEESSSSYDDLFLKLRCLVSDLSSSKEVDGTHLVSILKQKEKEIQCLINKRDRWEETNEINNN